MARFPNVGRLSYDEYWTTRSVGLLGYLRERELMLRDLIPPEARVLDAGCGNTLLPVALKGKGCAVSVADISSAVLDAFERKGIPGFVIDLDRVSETALPGRYDCIILSEVLEHTRNPEEILKTLAPHTQRFALTVPNSAYYRFRLQLMFGGRFFKQWVIHPSEHLRFWSHCDFLDWLQALGFEVEYARPSNGLWSKKLPFLKNLWPNLLGHQMVYICRVRE